MYDICSLLAVDGGAAGISFETVVTQQKDEGRGVFSRHLIWFRAVIGFYYGSFVCSARSGQEKLKRISRE